MVAAALGTIGLVGGLAGMAGGMRSQANPIAPMMYNAAGAEQQIAARAEADALGTQSVMAYKDSLYAAQQIQRQVTEHKEQQALDFASSGLSLQGSPLAELQRTQYLGDQEVQFTLDRGLAISQLYEAQGLQMLRQGSAAAFQGYAQGLASKFQGEMQTAQAKNQAFQTGLGGIAAGIKGFGSLFPSGTAGRAISGIGSYFRSSGT